MYEILEDILGDPTRTPDGAGHGVGLEAHECPSLTFLSDESIEENMVLALELAYVFEWEPFGFVSYEDMILVTADGPEQLSTMPRLIVV